MFLINYYVLGAILRHSRCLTCINSCNHDHTLWYVLSWLSLFSRWGNWRTENASNAQRLYAKQRFLTRGSLSPNHYATSPPVTELAAEKSEYVNQTCSSEFSILDQSHALHSLKLWPRGTVFHLVTYNVQPHELLMFGPTYYFLKELTICSKVCLPSNLIPPLTSCGNSITQFLHL